MSRAASGWSDGIMWPALRMRYSARLSYRRTNPVVFLPLRPSAYRGCGFAAWKANHTRLYSIHAFERVCICGLEGKPKVYRVVEERLGVFS